MSHKLTDRQRKRVLRELEKDYLADKESRKRRREEKREREKRKRHRSKHREIEDLLEYESLNDR